MKIDFDERAREFAQLQAEEHESYDLNLGQLKNYAKFTSEMWDLDFNIVYEKLLSSIKKLSDRNYQPTEDRIFSREE